MPTTIAIKNVGPLVDTGALTIPQVTLLIGEQSTGKSTLMKILCFCQWVEKRCVIEAEKVAADFSRDGKFRKDLMKFHHLSEDFFSADSSIEYNSDFLVISQIGLNEAKVSLKNDALAGSSNFKVCFVPSERNLLSSIKNVEKVYRTMDYDMLFNHILEWGEAKKSFTESKPLPLVFGRGMKYYYDAENEREIIELADNKKRISPSYASSGVQSAMPISVMSQYLCDIVGSQAKNSPAELLQTLEKVLNSNVQGVSWEEKRSKLVNVLTYLHFSLFIEEPEQNLFPASQFDLLRFLIRLVRTASDKTGKPSSLFVTSHSPYVLTALNVLMTAAMAVAKNREVASKVMGTAELLPADAYAAYYITPQGRVESLIDDETGLIMGDFLDGVSSVVDDYLYEFNSIIYGNY